MEMSQRFHLDHLPKVVERALQGCRDIYQILDRAVRRHIEVSGAAVRWGSKTQVDF
jgi:exosome complex component RRP41